MKLAQACGASEFIGSHSMKRLATERFWVRGVDLKFSEFAETVADELPAAGCGNSCLPLCF
jgi:nucleoside-diphosphate-sugar epimerase